MRVIRIPCYASFCIFQTVEVEVVVVISDLAESLQYEAFRCVE
jgi:hypothetical protein